MKNYNIIMGFLFLIVLFPSLSLSLIEVENNTKMVNNANVEIEYQFVEKFESLAYQLGLQVTDWIYEKNVDAGVFSSLPSIKNAIVLTDIPENVTDGINLMNTVLNLLISQYSDYTEIFIIDINGSVFTSVVDGVRKMTATTGDQSAELYFTGAIVDAGNSISTDKPYFSGLRSIGSGFGMEVSQVVRDPIGNIKGVIVLRLDEHVFWNFFNKIDTSGNAQQGFYDQLGIPLSGDIYAVGEYNDALSPSRFENDNTRFIYNSQISTTLSLNALLQEGRLNGDNFGYTSDYRGIKIFGFYLNLGDISSGDNRESWFLETRKISLPITVVIEVDESEILAPLIELRYENQKFIITIFIVSLIFPISIVVIGFLFKAKVIQLLNMIVKSNITEDLASNYDWSD